MINFILATVCAVPIIIYGFYYSYRDLYRYTDLREFYKAFNIFKNEIDYSYRTISQSFLSISTKVNEPVSIIFNTLANDVALDSTKNNNIDASFEEVFENSIKSTIKSTFLNDRDMAELLDLSKTINHLDTNAILSSINIYLLYLENELLELEKTKTKNQKTYQSLTILSTILVIIILL